MIFRRAALDVVARARRRRSGFVPVSSSSILAFYDELRRRDKTVAAFDRLMTGSLEPSADIDRGAERLLRLTRFLSAAFTSFEARVRRDRTASMSTGSARCSLSPTSG